MPSLGRAGESGAFQADSERRLVGTSASALCGEPGWTLWAAAGDCGRRRVFLTIIFAAMALTQHVKSLLIFAICTVSTAFLQTHASDFYFKYFYEQSSLRFIDVFFRYCNFLKLRRPFMIWLRAGAECSVQAHPWGHEHAETTGCKFCVCEVVSSPGEIIAVQNARRDQSGGPRDEEKDCIIRR
jgi:hypothetical protein